MGAIWHQLGGIIRAEVKLHWRRRGLLVLLLGLLLFFQSGNEFIVGGYTTTLLTSEVGMSVGAASYALAGYWAALMLTRAWLGRGRSSLTGGRLVLASAFCVLAVVSTLAQAADAHPGREGSGFERAIGEQVRRGGRADICRHRHHSECCREEPP